QSSHRLLAFFFFSSTLPPAPTSTLLPYTTLFRSYLGLPTDPSSVPLRTGRCADGDCGAVAGEDAAAAGLSMADASACHTGSVIRSEEHTSELQSRFDLVCRLLLEKKNAYTYPLHL